MSKVGALVEEAADQHALITRGQALSAGVSAATIDRYVARGVLAPQARGIYHLTLLPLDRYSPYQAAVLASGDGVCVSHASVLEMLDLCDVLPPCLHITVPRDRHPRVRKDDTRRLHRIDLRGEEVSAHEGIVIMAPHRAIAEALRGGEDPHQMVIAVRTAANEGLLTSREQTLLERVLRSRFGC